MDLTSEKMNNFNKKARKGSEFSRREFLKAMFEVGKRFFGTWFLMTSVGAFLAGCANAVRQEFSRNNTLNIGIDPEQWNRLLNNLQVNVPGNHDRIDLFDIDLIGDTINIERYADGKPVSMPTSWDLNLLQEGHSMYAEGTFTNTLGVASGLEGQLINIGGRLTQEGYSDVHLYLPGRINYGIGEGHIELGYHVQEGIDVNGNKIPAFAIFGSAVDPQGNIDLFILEPARTFPNTQQ